MVQSIWSFFVGPKKSRTKFFTNEAIVPKKKEFGPFFLLLPTITDIEYFLLGCTKFLGIYGASYKIISLRPRGCWKKNFLKKTQSFQWKRNYRVWQTSVSNSKLSTRYYDKLGWKFQDLCLGPKSLYGTQIFSVEKIFWPSFLLVSIVTNFKWLFISVQRDFDNYCGSYKIFSLTPKMLLKTQFFEKKAIFSVKKKFCPIFFFVLSKVTNLREHFKKSTRYSDDYCGS